MRIMGGSQRSLSTASEGRTVAGMKRSEFVSDLFNNRTNGKEDKSDFKLRLSYLSRQIQEELRGSIEGFLKEHPDLNQDLQEIEIPEHAFRGDLPPKQETYRKMYAYMQWLRMQPEGSEPPEEMSETEGKYWSVYGHGRNQEILSMFEQQNKKRQAFIQDRARHAPSYYYMAYPETYSFN